MKMTSLSPYFSCALVALLCSSFAAGDVVDGLVLDVEDAAANVDRAYKSGFNVGYHAGLEANTVQVAEREGTAYELSQDGLNDVAFGVDANVRSGASAGYGTSADMPGVTGLSIETVSHEDDASVETPEQAENDPTVIDDMGDNSVTGESGMGSDEETLLRMTLGDENQAGNEELVEEIVRMYGQSVGHGVDGMTGGLSDTDFVNDDYELFGQAAVKEVLGDALEKDESVLVATQQYEALDEVNPEILGTDANVRSGASAGYGTSADMPGVTGLSIETVSHEDDASVETPEQAENDPTVIDDMGDNSVTGESGMGSDEETLLRMTFGDENQAGNEELVEEIVRMYGQSVGHGVDGMTGGLSDTDFVNDDYELFGQAAVREVLDETLEKDDSVLMATPEYESLEEVLANMTRAGEVDPTIFGDEFHDAQHSLYGDHDSYTQRFDEDSGNTDSLNADAYGADVLEPLVHGLSLADASKDLDSGLGMTGDWMAHNDGKPADIINEAQYVDAFADEKNADVYEKSFGSEQYEQAGTGEVNHKENFDDYPDFDEQASYMTVESRAYSAEEEHDAAEDYSWPEEHEAEVDEYPHQAAGESHISESAELDYSSMDGEELENDIERIEADRKIAEEEVADFEHDPAEYVHEEAVWEDSDTDPAVKEEILDERSVEDESQAGDQQAEQFESASYPDEKDL